MVGVGIDLDIGTRGESASRCSTVWNRHMPGVCIEVNFVLLSDAQDEVASRRTKEIDAVQQVSQSELALNSISTKLPTVITD